MAENTNYDFLLSRLNDPQKVLLDKRKYSHTCGRGRHNEIVCKGLLVSREHCLFVTVNNEVFVMDLKSSNGTFVNGKSQPSNNMVKLQEGDIIGIGCASLIPSNDEMFAYKLEKCKAIDILEEEANQSVLSETKISNFNQTLNTSNCEKPAGSVSKRRTTRSNEDGQVPCKMRKFDDKALPPADLDGQMATERTANTTKKCTANAIQTLDLTSDLYDEKGRLIWEDSLDEIWVDEASTNNAGTRPVPDTAHDLMEILNISSDSAKKSRSAGKRNLGEKSQEERKVEDVRNVDDNVDNERLERPKNADESDGTRQSALAAKKRKTCWLNAKRSVPNSDSAANARRKDRQSGKNRQSNDGNERLAVGRKSKVFDEHSKSVSNVPLVNNGYQGIKLEEELQITDDEIDMNEAKNVDDFATSPLKLKRIDQEPITRFSAVDVVTLSDDDDSVFPCSQLFDDPPCGGDVATAVKTEIKEELIEVEDHSFSRVYDDVIILSDSDDEDNVWLEKLSRSQVYNSTLESDNSAILEDLAEEATVVEAPAVVETAETAEAAKTAPTNKDKGFGGVAASGSDGGPQINARTDKKDAKESLLTRNLRVVLDRCLTVQLSNTDKGAAGEGTLTKSPKASTSTLPLKASSETSATEGAFAKIAERGAKVKEKEKVPLKRKTLPIIEPPLLQRNSNCTVTIGSNTKDVSNAQKSTLKSAEKGKNRTKKEAEKEERNRKKVEQYLYEKEQKNRRLLHKWASCVPAKGTRSRSSLSKEEKTEIIKERKEKLKRISAEGRKTNVSDLPAKRAPAKAKVSRKTRFDCLVEDTIASSTIAQVNGKPAKEKSNVQPIDATEQTSPNVQMDNMDDDTLDVVAKDLQAGLHIQDKSKADGETSRLIDKLDGPIATTEAEQDDKIAKRTKPIAGILSLPFGATNAHKLKSSPERKQASSSKSKKKRVTFSDHNQVRLYEIDPNNKLIKFSGKDAPIPGEKLPTPKANAIIAKSSPTLREFLHCIFLWNPVWLEEQVRLQSLPPVVKEEELIPMLTFYKSFNDYYHIVLPLLLLEIWSGVTKEFDASEKHKNRPTVMCSIVRNSIVQNQQCGTNVSLTTLMLEALITREDYYKEVHPVYGDLVYFEYVLRVNGKCTFHKIFAYVQDVYKTIITPSTHYNKDLNGYTKLPYALLTFTLMTRPIEGDIQVNRVQRMRTVTYLRANLRMVQAIQYLPFSPLVNAILQPSAEQYRLPALSEIKDKNLVTKDQLNEKQLEAVLTVTEAVVRKREPRICLIQGPPGTGKSKVIVNIITQILYGNDRYKNHVGRMRILVCAPSNAAIDEILLRLLAIRSNFEHRFKMVRIGRLESMHPTARDISVTELAKRDVKKTKLNSALHAKSSDSIQEEKVLLQAKINSLKCELMSQTMDEVYRKHLRMKIDDTISKYELLDKRKLLNEMNPRELAKIHRGAENKILEGADIITCTLSSCYTSQMESIFGGNKERISVCIVDEATQSSEAETLIPLMLGVNTLVLVGDPKQLPATVISQDAKRYGLDQSLFARLERAFENQNNNPIIMLDKQYRMAYPISYWPNKFFYGGKLKDAADLKYALPFHNYRVFNLSANQNKDKFSNTNEAEFIAKMIYTIMHYTTPESLKQPIKIGILTPYNNQRALVISKINERISSIPEDIRKRIITEVNTVDSFQGQERDVIIMSCVRSHGIGFLSDRQRLCVALTRAKHSLLICGNFKTFLRDYMWSELLRDAKSRGVYYNIDARAEPCKIKGYIIT